MASHETTGQSDEWFTPPWLFDSLGIKFDLDPCWPDPRLGYKGPYTPCKKIIWDGGQYANWRGSVWLNPPYGGRNAITSWLQKLAEHGDGIALVPNRTGANWWQDFAQQADALLFVRGKIRFLRPDGTEGKNPGYGNVLMAFGPNMARALKASSVRGVKV